MCNIFWHVARLDSSTAFHGMQPKSKLEFKEDRVFNFDYEFCSESPYFIVALPANDITQGQFGCVYCRHNLKLKCVPNIDECLEHI